MKLMFINAPFQSGWAYGVWEDGANGMSYYMHGTLDATKADLRDVLEREMKRNEDKIKTMSRVRMDAIHTKDGR